MNQIHVKMGWFRMIIEGVDVTSCREVDQSGRLFGLMSQRIPQRSKPALEEPGGLQLACRSHFSAVTSGRSGPNAALQA